MRLINVNAFAAGFIAVSRLGFGGIFHDINWVDDGRGPTSSKGVDPRSTRGHMRDHFDRSAAQERTIDALANAGRRASTPSERVKVLARPLEDSNHCHRSRIGQP